MENLKTVPVKFIGHLFSSLRESYQNLFLVPEDLNQNLADLPMPMEQINDAIAFAIQNQSEVKIQINLKNSVIEIEGFLKIIRNGRLAINDPKHSLSQTIEDGNIRNIELI